jgi:hypothetical protein
VSTREPPVGWPSSSFEQKVFFCGDIKRRRKDLLMDETAEAAAAAVFRPSAAMPDQSVKVCGLDFNNVQRPIKLTDLTDSFFQTGFQATNLGRAIGIVKEMVGCY